MVNFCSKQVTRIEKTTNLQDDILLQHQIPSNDLQGIYWRIWIKGLIGAEPFSNGEI